MLIGKKVHELRKARKMSLTELAEKTGIQIATLSRIEHMKMTGTLQSHMLIAKALGIELTDLYRDLPGASAFSEAEPADDTPETERFTYNDKASYEILANNILSKKMMPVMLKIEPGGETHTEQNQPSSERFVLVLNGAIELVLKDKTITLRKNHSLYFDASFPHSFKNTGAETARVLSVATPVTL
ncbi:MAG TPA: XRE family transcriptional regulator [Candidatus Omnitrophota bacterium]|nr:XRE family transcriptional regulator [Candidatus Omnitrophota bacterium]